LLFVIYCAQWLFRRTLQQLKVENIANCLVFKRRRKVI
jgi:hypothetical protein